MKVSELKRVLDFAQEELGWLNYENKNLKAEIRKLKQTKE